MRNGSGCDGGWGEDGATYWPDRRDEAKSSTPSQTAWAVLGLMAAGEVDGTPVRRGIEYLLDAPREDGAWREDYYNAVGFPPRLLSQVSRLQRLFSRLGACPLPPPARRQREDLALRVVTRGRRLGIVTGLPAEARTARGGRNEDVRIVCCGASTARAEALARTLVDQGAGGLLSFGTAGALKPGLSPGTVVIASGVVDAAGEIFEIDGDWTARLDSELGPALDTVRAPIAGTERPVGSVEAKAALGKSSGAAAVDMESHAVARVAASAGLPVAAIRVIVDPAERSLPSALLSALPPEGEPRAGRILVESLRRPADLPALARLSWDYRRALRSLRRVAVGSGFRFGFFD